MFRSKEKTKLHFIGIGGIGMSGIAEVLLNLGYKVSGSDVAESANVRRLKNLGAEIRIGHKKENINDVTGVVFSSAITKDNPEIKESKRKKIPLIKRAEMLAELMRLKYGIAVAGTHGKTTTSSIIATILNECDLDPTHIIGGIVHNLNGNARVGEGEFLVAEADESDSSFLHLSPVLSVITNIDDDHLDHYGSVDKLHKAFVEFANKVPFYGECVLNIDDPNIKKILPKIKKPVLKYGINSDEAQLRAENIQYHQDHTTFDLNFNQVNVGNFRTNLMGAHNVQNSLAAIGICHNLEIPLEKIKEAICKFGGVGRRFERIYEKKNLRIIDDYGHHPTEIAATLCAAKNIGSQKVVAIFEPHRFSRTKNCWQDFFHCFNNADEVYISDIYPASELPMEGINSDRLIQDINRIHPNLVQKLTDFDQIKEIMKKHETLDCVIITLGAGSIGRKIREIIEDYV